MSIELYKKTATELAAMLRTKEVSATEIASDAISRIKTIDKDVKAYLNITEEKALEAAAVTDKKIANN
ncbi:MAG: Asp-tRNA(Asn)/Glu-tRNA(Gln) amidotransferase subunit GatA, partial [Oscillospiraceae bacterium]